MEGQKIAAAIDIGTNSIKLCVARLEDGAVLQICDRVVITKLGEGIAATGAIDGAAFERSVRAICEMVEAARELGAVSMRLVGTQALRVAANACDFVSRVARDCGETIDVISGEEEAELTFEAVIGDLSAGMRAAFFDVGGGSTEIVVGLPGSPEIRASARVGALTLSRDALPGDGPFTREQIERAEAAAKSAFAEAIGDAEPRAPSVVSSGGSLQAMLSVAGLPRDGGLLTRAELSRQIDIYAGIDLAERKKIAGLPTGRADTILAGAVIARSALDLFGADEAAVSSRGLRHGAARRLLLDH